MRTESAVHPHVLPATYRCVKCRATPRSSTTVLSKRSLRICWLKMVRSIVPDPTRRYTCTGRCCPNRYDRHIACSATHTSTLHPPPHTHPPAHAWHAATHLLVVAGVPAHIIQDDSGTTHEVDSFATGLG